MRVQSIRPLFAHSTLQVLLHGPGRPPPPWRRQLHHHEHEVRPHLPTHSPTQPNQPTHTTVQLIHTAFFSSIQPTYPPTHPYSITAYHGHPGLLDYSSTKGAIVTFIRSLSLQLQEKKIRVNGVAPGPIWTPLIPASMSEEKTREHGKSAPMKRSGQPSEVAPSYVFLASPDGAYFSGQVLHPNGGSVVNG